MGAGGGLRVPGIGPTFPPSGIWLRGLAGFFLRSKQDVGCRRHLGPAWR